MKTGALMVMGAVSLATAACAPPGVRHGHWGGPLKAVSRLDCPNGQGQLTLKMATPDGKSCLYASDGGAEVQLSLVPVSGDPNAALDPIEAELKTLLPPPAPSSPHSTPGNPGDLHNVNIELPGVSIHAGDQRANIHVGTVHIDADGDDDKVNIKGGPSSGGKGGFSVLANDGGAIIRTVSGGPDVRTTLILTSDQAGTQGWRVVGYEARGPRTGPLVVATVKVKSDEHDRIFDDAKQLIRRSAGA